MARKRPNLRPNRPKRPKAASELSGFYIEKPDRVGNSDGQPNKDWIPGRGFKYLGGGLIDAMTREAQAERDQHPDGVTTWFDADGSITHVRTGDRWEEAMERVARRMGL